MKTAEWLKVFLLGVIAALLLTGSRPAPDARAADATMGGAAGDWIAVASDDALYLIHPPTEQIAVYQYEGNRFSLRAARNFHFDIRLVAIEDRLSFAEARQAYLRQLLDPPVTELLQEGESG